MMVSAISRRDGMMGGDGGEGDVADISATDVQANDHFAGSQPKFITQESSPSESSHHQEKITA